MSTVKNVFNSNGVQKVKISGSKAVKEILHDGNLGRMYVTFKNGSQYRAESVSRSQFDGGMKCKSIGRWASNILRKSDAERV